MGDKRSRHDPLTLWEDHEACWKMQFRGSLGNYKKRTPTYRSETTSMTAFFSLFVSLPSSDCKMSLLLNSVTSLLIIPTAIHQPPSPRLRFYLRQAVPVSVSQKLPIFAIMSRLNNVKIVLKYCQPWKTAYNKWKKVPCAFMHLLLIPLVRNLFSFVSEVSIWRTFMHSRQTFILCFWIKATVSQRWWYMEPFFICHFSRLDSIPTLSWQYWALTLSGIARLVWPPFLGLFLLPIPAAFGQYM